jgi:lysophospholipase L1-like esterase
VTSHQPTPNPTDGATGQTRVAFYGDSYTLGTGLADRSERWSTRICDERGWIEFNPSVNGLGYINNRMRFGEGSGDLPDQVITSQPDIVFVTMGLNDNFSFDLAPEAIHDQIDEDFVRLRAALPRARFIAVEPFWYTDERPESIAAISGWVREAATRIGADYLAGASHWIEGHPDWMAADGLHPNEVGYAEMTIRMNAALETIGF